ncbi:MAG: hypothetical protein AAB948_03755 [Patescibacteria group bacterium]
METRKITYPEIKVGDEFKLSKGERILLGRESYPVKGFTVYHVNGTSNEGHLSSYGVEIYYGNEGEIVVQKPELIINGDQYTSSNDLIIVDTRNKEQSIDRVYNAGVGFDLTKIKIQGDNGSNFVVDVVDSNTFKLSSVNIT